MQDSFTATERRRLDQFAAGLAETSAQNPTGPLPAEPTPAAGDRVTVLATLPDRYLPEDAEPEEPVDAVLVRIDPDDDATFPYLVRGDDGEDGWVHRVRCTGEKWLAYRAARAEALAERHASARNALAGELYRLRVMRQEVQGVLVGALPAGVREQLEAALARADRV